jgi:enoyl-CoA hydratase
MADPVRYEVEERIATITLDRPEARNALSAQVRRLLPELVARAGDDPAVDVVILTGADPAFCAGLDLKELGAGTMSPEGDAGGGAAAEYAESKPQRPIPSIAKPVIGAINGVAVTGGLELALACDFLVASERARFADTHARVGIQPGWGLTVELPAAVGVRRAKEMSATGNFVDAETALAWGLVNHVVPHDELLPFCRRLAADIVSNDQAGVRRLLQTYDEGALGTRAEAITLESTVSSAWLASRGDSAAEVEARRQGIVDRGRDQAGSRRSQTRTGPKLGLSADLP